MVRRMHLDGVMGVISFVFSLIMYFIIIPAQINDVTYGSVGLSPSILPKFSVICIAIFSLMLIFDNFILKKQTKIEKIEFRGLIILLYLLAYSFLIKIVGYYISTPIFLFTFIFFLKKYSKKRLLKYTFIIVIFVSVNYIFFEKMLKIIFPKGNLLP